MDSINDYAYVDFSYNGGVDWFQGTDWDLNFDDFLFSRYFEGLNKGGDFDPIITGNSYGWVQDQYVMQWHYAVKKGTTEAIYPDSIMIRFNFVSDSIQGNRDGWMIDDIRLEKLGCNGIPNSENEHIGLYPNPTGSSLHIRASLCPIVSLQILNTVGQCIINIPYVNSTEIQLDLGDIESGIYIVVTKDDYGRKTVNRIMKYVIN